MTCHHYQGTQSTLTSLQYTRKAPGALSAIRNMTDMPYWEGNKALSSLEVSTSHVPYGRVLYVLFGQIVDPFRILLQQAPTQTEINVK